jgi:hypothetical protein
LLVREKPALTIFTSTAIKHHHHHQLEGTANATSRHATGTTTAKIYGVSAGQLFDLFQSLDLPII